ncbi:hypothetical protein NDU88_002777 [Pleurodeles waltl]|uniref:Uncharacterized protein n=1 Tax=Pleurodeles waltl TaxID=8319 RepID=A0AAV7UWK2_PLEWA|nr:hypothetical protein NDU88_002777 [Pleurodeles waltl]
MHQHAVLCISQDATNGIHEDKMDAGCVKVLECQITIDDKELTILSDSGSPYTLVGDKNWELILGKPGIQLKETDINPGGYRGIKIDLIGYTAMKIPFKGRETVGKVYVSKRGDNLLAWRHQKDLGIILNPNATD